MVDYRYYYSINDNISSIKSKKFTTNLYSICKDIYR